MAGWDTVTDGRESRARSCLGGTLFYENSDRSEYTGEVLPSAGWRMSNLTVGKLVSFQLRRGRFGS